MATAPHDTLIDFNVDAVAVAVTDAGVASSENDANTNTGTVRSMLLPFPNSPCELPPQHLIVPACKTAHVAPSPLDNWVTPVTPVAAVGTVEFTTVPLASWR